MHTNLILWFSQSPICRPLGNIHIRGTYIRKSTFLSFVHLWKCSQWWHFTLGSLLSLTVYCGHYVTRINTALVLKTIVLSCLVSIFHLPLRSAIGDKSFNLQLRIFLGDFGRRRRILVLQTLINEYYIIVMFFFVHKAVISYTSGATTRCLRNGHLSLLQCY